MHTWYSPRGTSRGLLLAFVVASVWLAWSLGYSQGLRRESAKPPARLELVPITVASAACDRQTGDCTPR